MLSVIQVAEKDAPMMLAIGACVAVGAVIAAVIYGLVSTKRGGEGIFEGLGRLLLTVASAAAIFTVTLGLSMTG